MYQLVDLAGTQVLKAESADSASGLFKKQRNNLQKTPIMTDTDNTHGNVTAYYGDIYFSKN
jgi:hypothetical protein